MPFPELGFVSEVARIRKAWRREFELRAAPLDVTVAQLLVLCRLWQGDGISTSVLTQEAGSDGGTVTGILDRLESRGLIRRERSVQDRRAVQIWLTPEGSALQRPLMEIIAAVNRQATDGVDTEEITQLLRTLKTIRGNLHE